MQLSVNIRLEEPLSLPLNYNHIIQSVIYRSLSVMPDYASFLHEQGYTNRKRQYKMFHFGQLTGDYVVRGKKIIFQSYVMLEVRSPEPLPWGLPHSSWRLLLSDLSLSLKSWEKAEKSLLTAPLQYLASS